MFQTSLSREFCPELQVVSRLELRSGYLPFRGFLRDRGNLAG
jgi:hypothetical protein